MAFWTWLTNVFSSFATYLGSISVDSFNKFILACVALIALFLGPYMQWKIAKRQAKLQEDISDRTISMQEAISNRQIAMQEEISTRTIAMQDAIAARQADLERNIAHRSIADSIGTRRQTWINELRGEIAEYLTLMGRANELRRPGEDLDQDQLKMNFEEMAANYARSHELGVRIFLRMNPAEDDHILLKKLLDDLSDASRDPEITETREDREKTERAFRQAREAVMKQTQVMLKKEWERVKKGEI